MARGLLTYLAIAGGLFSLLELSGCGGGPETPQAPAYESQADLYEWDGDGLAGPVHVTIDLQTQRAEVTIGGQPAGWAVVATGKAGFDTPAGEYKILEKVADKHSDIYGITVDMMGNEVNGNADVRKDRPPAGGKFIFAPMPYWMRLTWTGIGMHAGPIPEPGTPSSHGCIRLPSEFAPKLFEVVKVGTPVTVVR